MRRVLKRVLSLLVAVVLMVAASGCASRDQRTVVTVWSWEPSMKALAASFEAENPDIRVEIRNTSGYENLNTAIQDGYGMPDVVQLEYFALRQYAVSGQLLDMTSRASSYSGLFTPGTWSSVQLNSQVYGLPMDSGPMAFFYNKDDFDQAGVDVSQIHTWDDYYQASKKLKAIGIYIAADSGDASFYDAMVWLAGGHPFHTSVDGLSVTVDLQGDSGTRTFTNFWQKMIDEGLINTHVNTWSDGWQRALGSGSVASVFTGAWMPSMLLSDIPGTAGLWRVAQMPTPDGKPANSENGGSALGILQLTRKPDAAFRFVDYSCRNAKGIGIRVDGGAFPADNSTLTSVDFLRKTTIKDLRGINVPYFGGQEFNRVLSKAAEDVSVGYQYLPFEVYARDDFRATVGTAYAWSNAQRSVLNAKAKIAAGQKDKNGNPIKPPGSPGPKVSLMDGISLWQKDLKEYGSNQGFTIH